MKKLGELVVDHDEGARPVAEKVALRQRPQHPHRVGGEREELLADRKHQRFGNDKRQRQGEGKARTSARLALDRHFTFEPRDVGGDRLHPNTAARVGRDLFGGTQAG